MIEMPCKYGTLKDRLRPMRGSKDVESSRKLLQGYVAHCNFVKSHTALKGKTPAQKAGLEVAPNWRALIDSAIQHSNRRAPEPKPLQAIKAIAVIRK